VRYGIEDLKIVWTSSKLCCRKKHHLNFKLLLQRRCKWGTFAQQNPASFGKQHSHSKCYCEIVCV